MHARDDDQQKNVQDDFWYSIIENYESSIADLKEEICRRRKNINDLELGMNGYLTYHMNKLFHKDPDTDILELYKVEGIKIYKQSSSVLNLKVPDLSCISVFTMENNDVSLMKFIKELARQENKLMRDIGRLREKECALKKAQREASGLVAEASRKDRRGIDEGLLVDTNQRLSEQNQNLKEELYEVRSTIMEQMQDTQMVLIKTIEDQLLINDDLEKQLNNFCTGDASVKAETGKLIKDLYTKVSTMNKKVKEQMDLNVQLRSGIQNSLAKLEEIKKSIIAKRLKELNPHTLPCVCDSSDSDRDPASKLVTVASSKECKMADSHSFKRSSSKTCKCIKSSSSNKEKPCPTYDDKWDLCNKEEPCPTSNDNKCDPTNKVGASNKEEPCFTSNENICDSSDYCGISNKEEPCAISNDNLCDSSNKWGSSNKEKPCATISNDNICDSSNKCGTSNEEEPCATGNDNMCDPNNYVPSNKKEPCPNNNNMCDPSNKCGPPNKEEPCPTNNNHECGPPNIYDPSNKCGPPNTRDSCSSEILERLISMNSCAE